MPPNTPLQQDSLLRSKRGRILASTWFALLVLTVATGSVVLLYLKGRTLEAMVGAGLLIIAACLILYGSGKKDKDSGRR